MDKEKIIYIASNGRSGSTLLELILNTSKVIWTMGEISVLPWEIRDKKQTCGCGEEVERCPFWKNNFAKLGEDILRVGVTNPFRDSHGTRKIIRVGQMSKILLGNKEKSQRFINFCKSSGILFRTIRNEAERKTGKRIEYLVDSSKGAYRLNWLSQCEGVELKMIHIIKEPRAFVYSLIKRDKKMVLGKAIRSALRYVVENHLIHSVGTKLGQDRYKLIKYEDLASDPARETKKIFEWLNLPESKFEELKEVENHGISGNLMRHRVGGIKIDRSWEAEMPRYIKTIVGLITYKSAKKYGYGR